MNNNEFNASFWLGNGVLLLALVMLLFFGQMWEALGWLALLVWGGVAGLGAWLLMNRGA